MDIKKLITDQYDEMVAFRRDLHEHAEPSGEEIRTASRISEELTKAGIEHIVTPYHAVIATIHGKGPGKTVALRGDIDALAMPEETGLPFACPTGKAMHACGHDGHATQLLAAAKALQQLKDQFPGTVKFLFQPAEESCRGAAQIVADGFLDDVDCVFGEHQSNNIPVGEVDIEPGVRHASSRTFLIDLVSNNTQTSQVVPAACAALLDMQTLSSRETPPEEMFVFSMCDIHGGIDPETGKDTMHMEGTCRTFNPEINQHVEEWTRRIFTETCSAYDVTATVTSECITESVFNDPKYAAMAKNSLIKLFGPAAYRPQPPTTGSEDFAYYLSKCPGVFAFIGTNTPDNQYSYPNHHPKFDFDEQGMVIGACLHVQFAYDFLTEE